LSGADDKAKADVEDNFRKTVSQVLGGAAVIIGAFLAYYGTMQTLQENRKQFDATERQNREQLQATENQSRRTVQTLRDQFLSAQVSKGLEDLGSYGDDKIMVRLGGIYALEGVMKIAEDYWSQSFEQRRLETLDWLTDTSREYQQPILEALCAFVRDRTKVATTEPPLTDVQAALTVIARRPPGRGNVDLGKANIPQASLPNANLETAHMRAVDLGSADLTKANLTGADLSDHSKLSRAILRNANLAGANLTDAILSFATLSGAKLTNANLTDADLTGADLYDADLTGADLTGADLSRTDLTSTSGISQSQLDRACGIAIALPSNRKIAECPKPIQ
jgi:uncharacterized protein YjbI with pentapeptide repeats